MSPGWRASGSPGLFSKCQRSRSGGRQDEDCFKKGRRCPDLKGCTPHRGWGAVHFDDPPDRAVQTAIARCPRTANCVGSTELDRRGLGEVLGSDGPGQDILARIGERGVRLEQLKSPVSDAVSAPAKRGFVQCGGSVDVDTVDGCGSLQQLIDHLESPTLGGDPQRGHPVTQ